MVGNGYLHVQPLSVRAKFVEEFGFFYEFGSEWSLHILKRLAAVLIVSSYVY